MDFYLCSGAEDVALIEYAELTGRPFRVFGLDTGRLNSETYRFFDAVEKDYNIRTLHPCCSVTLHKLLYH